MLTKTKAIVLRHLKFGESSLIVDLFTEQQGRLSFMVRIPKTQKGKLKKQLFQAMTVLEVEYDYRQRANMQHLRDARIAIPFIGIPTDPVKMSLSMFLAEFLYYCTRDEQQNEPLYQYIENSISWLDAAGQSYANAFVSLYRLLSEFGRLCGRLLFRFTQCLVRYYGSVASGFLAAC